MQAAIIVFLVFFILIYYLTFLKNSIFGVSVIRGNYTGIFIFYDFLLFILPSSILLNIYPIENFWVAFKVRQEAVFPTTILVLLSYFLFIFLLWFLHKSSPKNFRYKYPLILSKEVQKYQIFVNISIITSITIIIFSWLILKTGHAFTLSLLLEQSISTTRLSLSDNIFTKFVKHLFIIICPLLTTIVASPIYDRNLKLRFISLAFIFFIATWGGSKGPVLSIFLIYFFTWATFSRLKISIKSIIRVIFLFLILFFLTYQVVLLQYEMQNFNTFIDYFYQRVFIAQMIGVYEQFSLNIKNSLYFLHGIPFISFFTDYPIFHKDLMLITEDRSDASAIGIKNTYFIAEAYAMGGWLLILPAIVLYAINFALSYIIILIMLNKIINNNTALNKIFSSIFIFSYISVTGGFSDLMLFKIIIMLLILLSPVLLSFQIYKKIKKNLSTNKKIIIENV